MIFLIDFVLPEMTDVNIHIKTFLSIKIFTCYITSYFITFFWTLKITYNICIDSLIFPSYWLSLLFSIKILIQSNLLEFVFYVTTFFCSIKSAFYYSLFEFCIFCLFFILWIFIIFLPQLLFFLRLYLLLAFFLAMNL